MTEGEGGIVRQKVQRPLPNNGNNSSADLKIAAAAAMHSRRVFSLKLKQSAATLQGLHPA